MFEFLFGGKNRKKSGNESVSAVPRSPRNHSEDQNRIYLDYASITPTDERVAACIAEYIRRFAANPGSLYAEGVEAKKKLEVARAGVAKSLEAHPDEIYFTSGGTESNNLAILGVLRGFENNRGGKRGLAKKIPHIVSLEIEHPSIKELLNALTEEKKCKITYVPVGESGIVDPKEIKKALKPETVLVSVMYANNEIGTIQPIHEIAKVIRSFKKERADKAAKNSATGAISQYPYFHTDVCQAAAYETLRIPFLGADLMTLDGSKIYGPRSTGVLYAKRGVKISPLMFGGSQEMGLRPGTENVAGAAGFALALELCQKEREKESARIAELRDAMLASIMKAVPKVLVNGDMKRRLPNNINICLPGMDAEFAVLKLDVAGVCVSSVTSCRSQNEDSSSYVIEALARDATQGTAQNSLSGTKNCSKSSLRITLGRHTTKSDAEKASKAIIRVLTGML